MYLKKIVISPYLYIRGLYIIFISKNIKLLRHFVTALNLLISRSFQLVVDLVQVFLIEFMNSS